MKRFVFPMVATAGLCTGALCVGAPALAADLAPLYKAPPPPPGFNWTGLYVGGHIGGGWASESDTVGLAFPGGGFPTNTAFSTLNASGFLGGVQAGFNLQYRSPIVLGVEGEYTWSDLTGSASTPSPTIPGLVSTVNGKVSDIALVAGRVGYAVNTLLFYAKAGAVWEQTSSNGIATLGAAGIATFGTNNDTRTGWTAGGGIEWAFTRNWSTKIEYDHLGFGNQSLAITGLAGTAGGKFSSVTTNGTIDIIKAGVNYRFNWPLM